MNDHPERPFRLAVVVGDPGPGRRTYAVTTAFADEMASRLPLAAPTAAAIDLADYAAELVGVTSARIAELIGVIQAADVVIVGTPVVRSSYSGLLKLFLDQLPAASLSGTVVIPVTLAGEVTGRPEAAAALRAALAELDAELPVPAFAVVDAELADVVVLADGWLRDHLDEVLTAAGRQPSPRHGARR